MFQPCVFAIHTAMESATFIQFVPLALAVIAGLVWAINVKADMQRYNAVHLERHRQTEQKIQEHSAKITKLEADISELKSDIKVVVTHTQYIREILDKRK